MASVTSLDDDMRNLRLARYTPQAEAETRAWIEKSLGKSLAPGGLLEVLKDGVALCQLANLALQPQHGGIKYKASSMPFIQMENISHFLKACELPPLSLPAHDRFLTVDLFEQKDPAQVLQCLGAFSRQANRINSTKFPIVIGPRKAGTAMSPTNTGGLVNGGGWKRAPSPAKSTTVPPTMSPAMTGGSSGSQKGSGGISMSPPAPISSWSKRSDEVSTAPAWNIHQYGYMGGASQGNQGVSFGARRQITSQSPSVPSLAEKQKLRVEKEAAAERSRQQQAEEQDRQRLAAEEEERAARLKEEKQWEEETNRQRNEERQRIEFQKREWEEQERKWKEEEEARRREDAALQAAIQKKVPEKPRVPSSSILRGQTLSEWQREQGTTWAAKSETVRTETPEQVRVRELERQLEEARERERQYQAERDGRLLKSGDLPSQPEPLSQEPAQPRSSRDSEVSWAGDEREYLRQQHQLSHQTAPIASAPIGRPRPLPSEPKQVATDDLPPAPIDSPATKIEADQIPPSLPVHSTATSILPSAPIPEPQISPTRPLNRTEQFLTSNPAPIPTAAPRISSSREAGFTSLEQAQLRDSRVAGQRKTQAGGWASKSLLEREMERERERQREWEANQTAVRSATRDPAQGTGEGQSWDVNQYGYVGGDNMNRGSSVGSGINIGGRRQIVGPRPKP